MRSKLWVVVPAGGVGTRMNTALPKQYLKLSGHTVIEHTLTRLCTCEAVDEIVLGITRHDTYWQGLNFNSEIPLAVVEAGVERVDTVENCLQHIVAQGGAEDWALVHDAARPCVRIAEIDALINAVIGNAQGGILAVPLNDTVKRGDTANKIIETVSREGLWRAMTPQLFRVGELLSAIGLSRQNEAVLTDEASAMEVLAAQPLLVPCSPDNIKITLPHDILLAEVILQAQLQENDTHRT